MALEANLQQPPSQSVKCSGKTDDHRVPEPMEATMSPPTEETLPSLLQDMLPSCLNSEHKITHALIEQLLTWKDDAETMTFLQELFQFMEKRGTPVRRIPTVNKSSLNLCTFYNAVISRGGLVNVIRKKLWRQVTIDLDVPASCTSAAYTLRTHYTKYLFAFECAKKGFSTMEELQKAIETTFRTKPSDQHGESASPASNAKNTNGTSTKANASPKISVYTPKPLRHIADPYHWAREMSSIQMHAPMSPLSSQTTLTSNKDGQTQTSLGGNSPVSTPNSAKSNCNSVASTPIKEEPINFDHSPFSPFSRPTSTTSDSQNPYLWKLPAHHGLMNGSFMEGPLDLSTSPPLKDERDQGTQTGYEAFEMKAAGGVHMRIISRGNTTEGNGSMIVKMDINGVSYEGVLFSQMALCTES